ncbi:MAG: c-type cytochrome [Chloroflexi bacterium]|nr:c-type cytochrome [Chloroflexota bacterium]
MARLNPSNIVRFGLSSLLLTLLVLAAAPALAQTPVASQAAPVKAPDPQAGRESFAQNCAPCHGTTGRGDGTSAAGLSVPPTAFADYNIVAGLPLTELFRITKNGNMARMMPPWSSQLSDQQIWNTVAFAWTLHTTTAEVTMGQAVYEANCTTCHGPDGKGKPPMLDFSDFAKTSEISQNTWAQVAAKGRNTMPGFDGKITAAEQRAALEYVRSFSLGAMFRGPLEKGTGVISGTVTNGTTNQPLANALVDLGIFDSTSQSQVDSRTATTDAAGFFRFTELPTDTTLLYAAQVEYPTGIPNGSGALQFAAGQTSLDMPIAVYETTKDASGIRADQVHYIVEFDAGELLVTEVMMFSLDGNRTYVGDGAGTLRFTLPPNTANVEISDGELGSRYVPVTDGFVDTMPLPPGQGVRQMLFRYSVPFTSDTLDLVRTTLYPATNVNALVTDAGAQVTSQQLTNQGVRQTQNGNFINLTGQNIAANQPVTLRFTGLTNAAAASAALATGEPVKASGGTDRSVLFILAGVAGLGAVLLAAWPMLRKRGMADAAALTTDRDGLVDALAQLDLAHEAGRLSDAAYRDQRLRLKAMLLEVLRKSE